MKTLFLTTISFSNTLTIYNWSDYIDENILKEFTAETGIGINYKLYENNDELYDILKNGAVCDIAFPSGYLVDALKKEEQIQKIDPSKLAIIDNFDPHFLKNRSIKEYALPYFWGTTSIVHNREYMDIKSINDLWDKSLRDRIVISNDMRDMFAFALSSLGLDPNSEKEEDIQRAYKKLLDLVPNISGFSNNIDKLAQWFRNSSVYAAIAYNGDVITMMEENKNLKFSYPREGGIIWMDVSAICSSSKNLDNTYRFLNYLYSQKVAEKNKEEVGYLSPLKNSNNIKLTYPTEKEKREAIGIKKVQDSYNIYNMYWKKFLEKLELKGIESE